MVRHEATEAVGAIASVESVTILQKYLHDKEDVVRESCEVALDIQEYFETDQFQVRKKEKKEGRKEGRKEGKKERKKERKKEEKERKRERKKKRACMYVCDSLLIVLWFFMLQYADGLTK
jgi:hypothetical protein